jgi:hypothetical protein
VVFQPLKHYHAKALDIMVRDGVAHISKLEFLSCIGSVRQQAFKKSTILSAFKKTGIWPFNPQPILQDIHNRQAAHTPPPSTSSLPESSPFNTPITLRQMNKVASQLKDDLYEEEDLDPAFVGNINRFVRGALSLASELVQTKRDLGRTRYAQQIAQQRRAMKNTPLKTGGVLTVAEGREMVQQKEQDHLDKARKMVEAADLKEATARKRVFEAVAKTAREWRLTKRLDRVEIVDSEKGKRWLLRGF